MNCPQCGCRMKKEIICPYCKITGDEVRFASNKEAVKALKNGEDKLVLVSSYLPYDVPRLKLILWTFLGGAFGFDSYYFGKRVRGILQALFLSVSFISFMLSFAMGFKFMEPVTEVLTLVVCIYICIWLTNCVKALFGKCKLPVVLPDKQQLKERKEQYKQDLQDKENARVEKEAKKLDKQIQREKRKMEKAENKKNKKDNNE